MQDNEEFKPENISELHDQHYKAPKKAQKYVSGSKNGAWSHQENSKYVVFMEFQKEQMRSKEKRRASKLYKSMANYVGTRNPLQCRSHHQKLEEKYIYPNKIISHYKTHNDLTLYHQLKQTINEESVLSSPSAAQHLKLQEVRVLAQPEQEPVVNPQTDNSGFPAFPSFSVPCDPKMSQLEYQPYGYQTQNHPGAISWQPYHFCSYFPA